MNGRWRLSLSVHLIEVPVHRVAVCLMVCAWRWRGGHAFLAGWRFECWGLCHAVLR